MFKSISCLSLVTAALMAGASQSAFALEANAFGDRLVETSRLMGLSFSYGSATLEGDTVTLSDFTFNFAGEEPHEVPGDVVFEGVVETPEGGYTAERATIADVEYTDEEEGVTLNFVDIVAEGIVLPAEVSLDNVIEIGLELYDRISAGPLLVTDADGSELFAVDLMEATVEDPAADGGVTSSYQVTGIRADLSAIEEAEAQEVIAAFGVEEFTASMSGSGTWWPETGELTIEDVDFVIDNLGSISLDLALDGYTEEVYRETMKLNLKMAEMAEAGEEISEEEMEAMSEGMIELMGGTRLVSGSLRYDDNSLFMKVLDFVGAEQGVDGETFKAGIQFMVPMMLAEVENEAFKSMVTSAVNTFIADPQIFTLSVAPAEPVAFTEFEELDVEADPFVLVDRLNVQISAND
ncbi:hypothetical protein [Pelagibacterium luteolum]|uniref:DUF945 domain-containing protein n=1 Tax=Pelagibacterium luteolum TaxID=440168 RepID=A0A1G7VNU7_9HYPH|nr:hypothetical protein [Pelagibacterium luteolum]SDG61367.1 hypothetical protein SAMN04487974_104252 [Pelagibacterium luteolum]